MEFNPNNKIVQLCIQGMALAEQGKADGALAIFHQAWEEATNDFEKFLAAFYLARQQQGVSERLKWYQTVLQYAIALNDDAVKDAFSSLYLNIAECYEQLGDAEQAKRNETLAASFTGTPSDKGPFYHGTKAALQVGDLLIAGFNSNYQASLVMNHIYFTALVNGAGLAAALANGEGKERVYIVEPTGDFENDPNVTNKKFPGNPTRSYRTQQPLKIIGEATGWIRQTPEQIQMWRDRLASNNGEIIN